MLFSLLRSNHESQIILHIIHTPEARKDFDSKWERLSHFVWVTQVQLRYYPIDRSVIKNLGLPTYNDLPLTTYFRLLIPKLLDQTIEKCIYMDGDMIIRKDITHLYELALGTDDRVGGVMTNVLTVYMKNLDLNRYINAWMLVLNLEAWRKYDISWQCVEFVVNHPKGLHNAQPIMGDQCAINYICRNHIVSISPQRNATPMWRNPLYNNQITGVGYSIEEVQQVLDDPAVLHFAWNRKPCSRICFHPWRLEYYRYLFASSLIWVVDFVKVMWHIITYPLGSDGVLYRLLWTIRHR